MVDFIIFLEIEYIYDSFGNTIFIEDSFKNDFC